MYAETRNSGYWDLLRRMATVDGCIYGVASLDKKCPAGRYRYTLAARMVPRSEGTGSPEGMFLFHVRESHWLVFQLEHFGREYGGFWEQNPYKMTRELGHEFNKALSIHIDVYSETYTTDDDAMEFWMPVRSGKTEER